jgi:biotin synthase
LGETDSDMVDLFIRLCDREIFPYLFCFNPGPDSRLGQEPKSSITRWRRIQLAKHLIESEGFRWDSFEFDDQDALVNIGQGLEAQVSEAIDSGIPFMTNGCPGPKGEPGCTRPYGSYRPSEPLMRDYPFLPTGDDLIEIRNQLALDASET